MKRNRQKKFMRRDRSSSPPPAAPAAGADEQRRLARLRQLAVLDTETEPVFDALVRIAAWVCDTPISLISLIDENRQWFKAGIGLAGVRETPRDIAFCSHAILDDAFMEVHDATLDPRFASNPLVTGEPDIRFYASVPLVMPQGERVGTLCVIDRKPGRLSAEQRNVLENLAEITVAALLRRNGDPPLQLTADESVFKVIADSVPVGIFQSDAAGQLFYVNDRWLDIFGLTWDQSMGLGSADAVHPEDRDRVLAEWRRATEERQPLNTEFRLLRHGHELLHVGVRAQPTSWGHPRREGFAGVVADLSLHKQAEAHWRDAYRFLQRAEAMSGVGGWEADLRAKTVQWTEQTFRIYELPLDHKPAFNEYRRHINEAGQNLWKQAAGEAIHHGKPWDLELPATTAKGRAIWVRTVGHAEFEAGQAVRLVGTLQDITEARATQTRLRESEALRKRAMDASHLALWDLDVASGQLFLSEHWSDMLGGPREPLTTTVHEQLLGVPQADRPLITTAISAALKGTTPSYDLEHRVHTHDGRVIWIHSQGSVVTRDAQGRALHMTGTNRNITARKLAQEQSQRDAMLMQATLESTTDGILALGVDQDIVLCNQRFLSMWGIAPDRVPANAADLLREVQPLLKDGEACAAEVEHILANPQTERVSLLELKNGRVYERNVRPMRLNGTVTGLVSSYRDVTAQQTALAETEKARQAAEAANQAKSEFLANMSHEIRTPLNGVMGMAELLLTEHLTPQQRQYAELANTSAKSLLSLVNDLLDIGKIEAGRVDIEHIPFKLDELLSDLGDLYRLRAQGKGLAFRGRCAPDVPLALTGDPSRLRQILNNLLGNALKFTARGEIGLSVERLTRNGRLSTLRFTVHDTGIGIAPDMQQRLFTRFTQADNSTTRAYGGSGLGLAITRQLCEHLGGQVALASAPGRGCVFHCDLPFAEQASAAEPEPPHSPPRAQPGLQAHPPAAQPGTRGVRILVAEDNPTNQVVVVGLLRQVGYEHITVVNDGQEAVEAVRQNGFDVILMDCRMPVLDGYAATQQIRALGYQLPIIALTANASVIDREKCLRLGMNDYLPKPLAAAKLRQTLGRWTARPQPDANGPGASPPTSPAPADQDPAFDLDTTLTQLDGNRTLLRQVIASFLTHSPAVIEQLDKALALGQADTAKERLHTLAGSSGMAGATAIYATVKALERQAADGEWDTVTRQLPLLRQQLGDYAAASAKALPATPPSPDRP